MAEQESESIAKYNTAVGFGETGVIGLDRDRYHGSIYEEFLPTLTMPLCLKVYKEMSYNDPTVGAVLYMLEMLVRGVDWVVEAGGKKRIDLEIRDHVDTSLHDMSNTWHNTINEILGIFTYGWSWHEVIYKYRRGDSRNPKFRSKHTDGRIGWRKIPVRSQDSWYEWHFDEDGGVSAFSQQAPADNQIRKIPLVKSLLFRTSTARNNPEGKSLLRVAYRPWFFKKHIEEIEAIGIERELAGLPVMTPPEGVNIWNTKDERMVTLKLNSERIVRNIRRDENDGIVKPFGWELALMSSAGSRQIDTNQVINRHDQRIAVTMLADIVMLGAEKVGSYALADVKKSLLASALEAQIKNIADTFNKYAIPKLVDLNGFQGFTDYPKLVPGEIEVPDLRELGRYIVMLSGTNMEMFPDPELENYLRKVAHLPLLTDEQLKRRAVLLENKPDKTEQEEEEEAKNADSKLPGRR